VTEPVIVERRGAVLWASINREERRNALNEQVARGIHAALDAAEADSAIRAVVLTGTGERAFCAGGDLQLQADGTPFTIDEADPRHYVARLLRRMDACRLPLIARINGHALAGGFGLVCACDLAVAREDALIGVTEGKVGLFPMMILPYLLRTIPYRRMMELCITGEPITARLTSAPGNGEPIGGLKVTTESGWFAARPSGTEDVYKIYAESFRGAEHLARIQEEARDVVSAALGGA